VLGIGLFLVDVLGKNKKPQLKLAFFSRLRKGIAAFVGLHRIQCTHSGAAGCLGTA